MKLLFAEFELIKGFLQPTNMTVSTQEYSRHYKEELCHIEEYYVDYSRAGDELLIRAVGCGGQTPLKINFGELIYWHWGRYYCAHPKLTKVNTNGEKAVHIWPLPKHLLWMLDKEKWDGFGEDGQPARCEVEDTLYCSVCNDYFYDDQPCEHIFWSRGYGVWAGCGADELQDACKKSLFEFLKHLGKKRARKIRRVIASHSYDIYEAMGGSMCRDPLEIAVPEEQRGDCEDGYEWLRSLESGVTMKADILTVRWITEWLRRGAEAPEGQRVVSSKESSR